MSIFEGRIDNQGDIVEQTGDDLNKMVVVGIEGGVGVLLPVPEDISAITDEDFPPEMVVLVLELTTSNGEVHRLTFREDAVAALSTMVGDYATVKVHDMVQKGDVPPELAQIYELLERMKEELDD